MTRDRGNIRALPVRNPPATWPFWIGTPPAILLIWVGVGTSGPDRNRMVPPQTESMGKMVRLLLLLRLMRSRKRRKHGKEDDLIYAVFPGSPEYPYSTLSMTGGPQGAHGHDAFQARPEPEPGRFLRAPTPRERASKSPDNPRQTPKGAVPPRVHYHDPVSWGQESHGARGYNSSAQANGQPDTRYRQNSARELFWPPAPKARDGRQPPRRPRSSWPRVCQDATIVLGWRVRRQGGRVACRGPGGHHVVVAEFLAGATCRKMHISGRARATRPTALNSLAIVTCAQIRSDQRLCRRLCLSLFTYLRHPYISRDRRRLAGHYTGRNAVRRPTAKRRPSSRP